METYEVTEKMYEGKTKILFETNDPKVALMRYKDDITAGNGEKHDLMENKAKLNCTISKKLFEHLTSTEKVAHHYIGMPNNMEMIVKKVKIFPVEVVLRNISAGSFCKRYGIESGRKFQTPVLELFYKDDSLNDPLCSDTVVHELGWAMPHELQEMKRQAWIVHKEMTEYWEKHHLTLVDAKYEFGMDKGGNIMLADELTLDSCRLWDNDGKSLDKDVFRKGESTANVKSAYQFVHDTINADPIV